MDKARAVIVGGGPAGLTAAFELLEKTDIKPVIYEMTGDIGGISKTVNYKGNRIDIGGHRFFSKSDRVMEWWNRMMPVQGDASEDRQEVDISYRRSSRSIELSSNAPDPRDTELVMLIRDRLSRIFCFRKFFDYPVTLNLNTFKNLGFARVFRIGISYLKARIMPIKSEQSLEDFFVNRFGKELYETFFKDYTEKVWGVSCREIEPEWGAQRIKGLSVTRAVLHAVKKKFLKDRSIGQKGTETSLIEKFLYPKYGPGQLWEEVARKVVERGGEILHYQKATGIRHKGNKVVEIRFRDEKNGSERWVKGDYFFSTMPVKELIAAFETSVPGDVREVAQGLVYRDFVTLGLLLKKMKIKNETDIGTVNNIIPDNWIYIQEREVRLGRLQVFNNWSPYMVKDPDTVWLGLEYFCNEDDDIYTMPEEQFSGFAVDELARIDIINKEDVLDSVVIKMPKTYPAYFGRYNEFDVIKNFTDTLENLYLIGRNGQHKYNNSDHSMLTAMIAVENIRDGVKGKDNIWSVNVEQEYHETKG